MGIGDWGLGMGHGAWGMGHSKNIFGISSLVTPVRESGGRLRTHLALPSPQSPVFST
jgi:hypothetical protein